MTDEAEYKPLPMPHGRVRPAPPALLVQEGRLPSELVAQARARQAQAEVLVLPREAEAHLRDGDPSLAIYSDNDMLAVDVLRRGGVSVDYLAEHRKVVAQFAAAEWTDLAVLVSAGITVETVVGLARYLAGRIRKARESRVEQPLDLTLGRPDGTFLRTTGSDTEAVSKAFYAGLTAVAADPTARDVLLRLAAGADPSTALAAPKSQRPPFTQKAMPETSTIRTKTKVAVDLRDLLTSGDRPLESPEDLEIWQPFADVMGLSPYVCKAFFTCGVLRELIGSAGLCLGQSHYLGALFLALDATELVGRCAGGFREQPRQARLRLEAGLRYLERIDPEPGSLAYGIEAIVDLRNFLGHGAASSKPGMTFTRELIARLLQLLALALNRFWQADKDSEDRLTKFAQAEISPMVTNIKGRLEPVYVRDVQRLLASRVMPGDRLDHEESWRLHFVLADNTSVPATGSPGPGGPFVLSLEAPDRRRRRGR